MRGPEASRAVPTGLAAAPSRIRSAATVDSRKTGPGDGSVCEAFSKRSDDWEVKMNMTSKFPMTAALFALSIVPVLSSLDKPALGAKIKEAAVVLLNPASEAASLETAFKRLVEVVDTAAPESGFPAEFGAKINKARQVFASTSILNPAGLNLLREAYASINGGQPFRFPEGLTGLAAIRAHIEKLSESTLKNFEAGRTGASVKSILEILIMIVTPVEAPEGV
jgi:hypothetical protein